MTVESATYTSGLNASNPASGDPFIEGDDHIRLLKSTIKATFPNVTGAVTATQGDLNTLTGAAGVVVLSSSGVGYGAGAGGAVTQATSKSTAVTLNKACGQIMTNNEALAPSAGVYFLVANTCCKTTSTIVLTGAADGATDFSNYVISAAVASSDGSFYVNVRNVSSIPLNNAIKINFAIIAGVTS